MVKFLTVFTHYCIEILPALAVGFFISGLIHEFVPGEWVEKNLGKKGLKGILYATITGTLLPICCWGSLPVAISLYKKGSRLGPILAFLVATPATSISALIVTYKVLGAKFAVFIFFAVIVMGIGAGLFADVFLLKPKKDNGRTCPHCETEKQACPVHLRSFRSRIYSIFKFAFWDLPAQIGPQLLLGIVLAAIVAAFIPVGLWIKNNLSGLPGYLFALIFGLLMYICSTATVPLADAFIKQGLSSGAGVVLLLAGPITSYGTILVLKKEFGAKVLAAYLIFVSVASLAMGYIFSLI